MHAVNCGAALMLCWLCLIILLLQLKVGDGFLGRPSVMPRSGSRALLMTRQGNELKTDWGFLDGIYLITTEGGDDRVSETKEQLEKVGMWGKVQVRTFKTDDEDRVRGCYSSHINVLTDVKKTMQGSNDYKVLILEDNLETTARMSPETVNNVAEFLGKASGSEQGWDVFHLAYMMYVPGLFLKGGSSESVVQMYTDASSAVGTSAYIISKRGVERMVDNNAQSGYVDAVPNVMSRLFPQSRYAAYPMVFHRAGKTKSLVNPQLDDFRKVMFTPTMYTFWEKLMVGTGLQNNQLFPGLMITLLFGVLATAISALNSGGFIDTIAGDNEALKSVLEALPQILVSFPLFLAIWGATLFTPGVTDGGYAKGAAPTDLNKA